MEPGRFVCSHPVQLETKHGRTNSSDEMRSHLKLAGDAANKSRGTFWLSILDSGANYIPHAQASLLYVRHLVPLL